MSTFHFHWDRLFHSEANAIATLCILGFCCIICLSYLSTMLYVFLWYIPTQKLLKSKTASYYHHNSLHTQSQNNNISRTRTCSASQQNNNNNIVNNVNLSPNNIRLSITSNSADTTINEQETERRESITATYEPQHDNNNLNEPAPSHQSQNSVISAMSSMSNITEIHPMTSIPSLKSYQSDDGDKKYLNIPNAKMDKDKECDNNNKGPMLFNHVFSS